jgi:uncharacterized protein YkwD
MLQTASSTKKASDWVQGIEAYTLRAMLCVAPLLASFVVLANSSSLDAIQSEEVSSLKWTSSVYLPPPPSVDAEFLVPLLQESPPKRREQKANQSSLTRAQVVNLYNTLYVPGNSATMGWTGAGLPTCAPGGTNATYRQATLDRINFYRQLAGLPTITFFDPSEIAGVQAQSSALMQASNSGLSHSPPTSWICYTADGASGAGRSNLAKGRAGPGAIDLYMIDSGSSNYFVGHRRWLLYPPLIKSYSGDVPSGTGLTISNDLIVFGSGSHGARPATPNGVAWPPGGFIPYQVLPGATTNRWSFSYPNANFASATVSILKNGQSVPVTYETLNTGGYGDQTLVFLPNTNSTNGPFVSYASPGTVDQSYVVTVTGMTGSGVPSSVTYTVTVIDPTVNPNVSISGAATLSPSGNAPAGTSVCANPSTNVTCGNVDASGQYSCSVPAGWSGTLHLQAGNTKRVVARRFATAVSSAQVNQDFLVYNADASTATFDFACNLDIDNNGLYEAVIDGAMIMRKLFGVTGIHQAIAASGACAQRTSASEKATFLDAHSLNAFDVNAIAGRNAQPLLDGLVLLRLMLGVPSTQAVVGTDLNAATVVSEVNSKCGANFQ